MSKTTNALLFKFLLTLVVAGIAFGFISNNAFKWVALVAILGTVLDYLVGDLLILPRVGSLIGAVVNGVLAAVIAIVVTTAFPAFIISPFSVLVFAVLTGVGEYYFHRYLLKTEEVEP